MYLALMEATLGNYKMEKQAFIPLWKEFSFPNGSFKKKTTFSCIFEDFLAGNDDRDFTTAGLHTSMSL